MASFVLMMITTRPITYPLVHAHGVIKGVCTCCQKVHKWDNFISHPLDIPMLGFLYHAPVDVDPDAGSPLLLGVSDLVCKCLYTYRLYRLRNLHDL